MIYPNEKQTAEAVAEHYNSLDKHYRALWGEHVHHGYFKTGTETIGDATEKLIELVVKTGKIDDSCKVCDVGCGYGATARRLTKRWEAQVTALTVSKSQWQYARASDPESMNPRYILGDFLKNDFPDKSYDVVISIESSEHMVDKQKFFDEAFRILKPGGRFVTCAWLSKENPTNWEIKHLLEPICREGRLPSMGTAHEYQEMMEKAGFSDFAHKDISNQVKKTWSICIYHTAKAFLGDKQLRKYLLDKKSSDRVFAKTLFRLWTAYNTKSMRYGIISGIKK